MSAPVPTAGPKSGVRELVGYEGDEGHIGTETARDQLRWEGPLKCRVVTGRGPRTGPQAS
jgi:hypothetical protein